MNHTQIGFRNDKLFKIALKTDHPITNHAKYTKSPVHIKTTDRWREEH